MPPGKISSVLAAFEANIDKNKRHGGATSKTFLNNIAAQRSKVSDTRSTPPTVTGTPTRPVERRTVSPTTPEAKQPSVIAVPAELQPKPTTARSILRKDGRFVASTTPSKKLKQPQTATEVAQEEPIASISNNDVPKRILASKPSGQGSSKRRLVRRKSSGRSSRSRSKGPAVRRSKSLGAKSRQTDETNQLLMEQIKRSKDILSDINSLHSSARSNGFVTADDVSSADTEDHTYSSVGTLDFNGSSVAYDLSNRDGLLEGDDDDDYSVPIEMPREHKQSLFERMKHWSENEHDACSE